MWIFFGISRDTCRFIYVKFFVFCFKYYIHNISQCITIMIEFHQNILCFVLWSVRVQSDISQLMCISPPWSHCFVKALFRTIVRRFLASLLPMPALCQFLGSLLSDHRAQLLRVAVSDVMILLRRLAFPFWQPGTLGVQGYRIAQSTSVRDTVVFVQHTGEPV